MRKCLGGRFMRLGDVADDRCAEDDDRRVVEKGRSGAAQPDQQPKASLANALAEQDAALDRGVEQARKLHRVGNDEQRGEGDDRRARERSLDLAGRTAPLISSTAAPHKRDDVGASLVEDQCRDHANQHGQRDDLVECHASVTGGCRHIHNQCSLTRFASAKVAECS